MNDKPFAWLSENVKFSGRLKPAKPDLENNYSRGRMPIFGVRDKKEFCK
jgi:hypothetical protein